MERYRRGRNVAIESRRRASPGQNRRPIPRSAANFVWYLVAIAMGALILVSILQNNTQVEISYSELLRLIEQGRPRGSLDGGRKRPRSRGVRYSDLRRSRSVA